MFDCNMNACISCSWPNAVLIECAIVLKVTQMTEIGYRAIDNNNDDNFKCIWDRSLEVIEDWSAPVLHNHGVLYILLSTQCLVRIMVPIYTHLRCSFLNIKICYMRDNSLIKYPLLIILSSSFKLLINLENI